MALRTRKGYGRFLADSVRALASETKLNLRVLVSYADTEPDNLNRLEVAAKMLGVAFEESDIPGAHLIGTKGRATLPALERRRPARPAFILERLRSSDEKPIDSPTQFVVLFGTNRKPTGDAHNPTFSNERDTCLHTGKVTVTIPTTHRFGCKGSYWHRLWAKICGDSPTLCKSTLYQAESEFATDISAMRSPQYQQPHNLLYIHGFSVNFEDACAQAARFGVDLKITGTTFLYSWPSCGRFGLNNYMADEATAGASLPYFEEFVEMIMAHTSGVPLSIIVHSMGNRIVTRFFEALAVHRKHDGRFKHVVFAAPDVDSDEFSQSVTKFASLSHFTLYATRGDYALQASEWCHKNSRAGLAPPVITASGIDTVLVEGFNLLNLGHSYYAEASALLHDLFCLIHMSLSPEKRPAIRRAETTLGKPYWKLAV